MIDAYRRWRYQRLLADAKTVRWAMRGQGRNFAYPISRCAGIRAARTYRALARLEQEGSIHTGLEETALHPRRWYQLTEQGMREITPQVVKAS